MNTITKKMLCVVFISCVLAWPARAIADMYEWQDEKGDVHMVDDILLVPPQYKDKARALKTKPSEKTSPPRPDIQPSKPSQSPSEQEEMYGERPLNWWETEFNARKNEISELKKTIEEQKKFMADYERSRRLYRLYSKEDVEKYEAYKKELPENEARLNELKTDLDEFRHKAQTYGVPRAIRE